MGIDNVSLKTVPVTIDKPRGLRYSNRSFQYLSQLYGSVKQAQEYISDVEGMQAMKFESVKALGEVVYAGLLHEKDVDKDTLLDYMDMANMPAIIQAVAQALQGNYPEAKKDQEGSENPQK
jgi:hypothetical protein